VCSQAFSYSNQRRNAGRLGNPAKRFGTFTPLA
jgi:hypothetical protein